MPETERNLIEMVKTVPAGLTREIKINSGQSLVNTGLFPGIIKNKNQQFTALRGWSCYCHDPDNVKSVYVVQISATIDGPCEFTIFNGKVETEFEGGEDTPLIINNDVPVSDNNAWTIGNLLKVLKEIFVRKITSDDNLTLTSGANKSVIVDSDGNCFIKSNLGLIYLGKGTSVRLIIDPQNDTMYAGSSYLFEIGTPSVPFNRGYINGWIPAKKTDANLVDGEIAILDDHGDILGMKIGANIFSIDMTGPL